MASIQAYFCVSYEMPVEINKKRKQVNKTTSRYLASLCNNNHLWFGGFFAICAFPFLMTRSIQFGQSGRVIVVKLLPGKVKFETFKYSLVFF